MIDIKVNKDTYIPYDNIFMYLAYSHNSIKERVRTIKKQNKEKIFDLTDGKKILSVIFMKNGQLVLLNTSVETLASRINAAQEQTNGSTQKAKKQ